MSATAKTRRNSTASAILDSMKTKSREAFADDPPAMQGIKAMHILSGPSKVTWSTDGRSNRVYLEVHGGLVQGEKLALVQKFMDLEIIVPARKGGHVDYVFRPKSNGKAKAPAIKENGDWRASIKSVLGGGGAISSIKLLQRKGEDIDLVLSNSGAILGTQLAALQRNCKVEMIGLDALSPQSLHLWLRRTT